MDEKYEYFWCPTCKEVHEIVETGGDDECPLCGHDMIVMQRED